MRIERTDVVWLSARADYSIDEVARMSGLPIGLVEALADCGALPASEVGSDATIAFASEGVVLAQAAGRLREHFELDEHGVAVAISLLRRVRLLEARLASLRAAMSASSDPGPGGIR